MRIRNMYNTVSDTYQVMPALNDMFSLDAL